MAVFDGLPLICVPLIIIVTDKWKVPQSRHQSSPHMRGSGGWRLSFEWGGTQQRLNCQRASSGRSGPSCDILQTCRRAQSRSGCPTI